MSERLIKHWTESSDRNFDTMLHNYKSKDYNWALYIGHLVLEKLLKAIFVKTHPENPQPPFTHNLIKLAAVCGLDISDEMREKFGTINTFNIEAKYEDDKKEFYLRCTREYTDTHIKNIKEIREWLKGKLTQQ